MGAVPNFVPGSPLIIADQNALATSSEGLGELATDITNEKSDLTTKSEELHDQFRGVAGDAFYGAFLTTMDMMQNIVTRYNNASTALSETSVGFGAVDTDSKDDLLTISKPAGGGAGNGAQPK